MLDRNPAFNLVGCDEKEKWAVLGNSRWFSTFSCSLVAFSRVKACIVSLLSAWNRLYSRAVNLLGSWRWRIASPPIFH